MATQRQPDAGDIRELVAFLPRLYGDEKPTPARWHESQKREDGSRSFPWPEYNDDVRAFIDLVWQQGCWHDDAYDMQEASRLFEEEPAVRNATIAEIQTMLTFILRGERFCDGFWEGMIENGHVRRVLERLAEIERQGLVVRSPADPT